MNASDQELNNVLKDPNNGLVEPSVILQEIEDNNNEIHNEMNSIQKEIQMIAGMELPDKIQKSILQPSDNPHSESPEMYVININTANLTPH